MLLKGSDIVMECLIEQGVTTVFGYPGNAILGIYDALYRYQKSIRHILMTHEQHAAHAADGYARASGGVGVAFATSGPGATNLLTGLSSAYIDSTPVIAITSNVARANIGKDSFQEVDIFGVSMPITKHNFIVRHVEELADTIREAFYIAQSGRKGPVLIDIPADVTEESCPYSPRAPKKLLPVSRARAEDYEVAAKLIDESECPMIFAGGGIVAAEAEEQLEDFSRKICAPVAVSLMGTGCFAKNERYAGMMGMFGAEKARECRRKCDLLIAVGTRFSERSAPQPEEFARGAKVLHIDVDPAEINKNVPADLSLIADAKLALARLYAMVREKKQNALLTLMQRPRQAAAGCEGAGLHPHMVFEALNRYARDVVFTTEVGQHQIWAARHLDIREPHSFLTSGGLGAMGFGLGAAIGAAFATGRQVVNIAGDGSFYMNLAELSTVVRYGLPVVQIVFRNGSLGLVRQMQKRSMEGRYSAVDMDRGTDFVRLAEAFGVKAARIDAAEQVEGVIQQALRAGQPCLIDCAIDIEELALPLEEP